MAQNFYFAWIDPGEAFNAAVHNREDEDVFSFKMTQQEGDFANLELVIKNPRIGLLNPARKVWCWFSMNRGTDLAPNIQPIFKGRLKGVPDNIFDTLVTISFIARPLDFVAQKLALAETLKVLPYWDPIFIAPDSWSDPDTVLEARSALWHINPITHVVSISDVIVPEDGTTNFSIAQVLYDGVAVQLQTVPLRSCSVQATIPWTQVAAGGFDITNTLLQKFPGSGGLGGLISSFTFQGLSSSWPKDGAKIGDGYTVAVGNLIDQSFLAVGAIQLPDYFDPATIPQAIPEGSILFQPKITGKNWGGVDGAGFDTTVQQVVIPIGYGRPNLQVSYAAKRDLAQHVTFTLFSDMQAVVTLAGDDEAMVLNINANKVSDLTADNSLPIGDVRARDYVHSARGRQSVEHLVLMARANLIIRSRAVDVSWKTALLDAIDITTRKGAIVNDNRLPGGQATGKIVAYAFELDGSKGEPLATITIGCAVGYGGSHVGNPGTPTWVDASWVGADWQEFSGTIVLTTTSDITYSLPVQSTFDDGVDFQHGLTPTNSIEDLTINNGPVVQRAALLAAVPGIGDQAAASAALQLVPTTISLKLRPLSGGPFVGEVPVGVSDLVIPKQIDLEAASV